MNRMLKHLGGGEPILKTGENNNNNMSELSIFKSRQGNLSCSASELYEFVTDIRNFKQFVPEKISLDDLRIERESCSFNIPSMGTADINLSQKVPDRKVVYSGTVFQSNDFDLIIDIGENIQQRAKVQLNLEARLNPMLKMMASAPIGNFLEKLIDEMEKFRGWNKSGQ